MKTYQYLLLSCSILPSLSWSADFIAEVGLMDWSSKSESIFGEQRSENVLTKLTAINATDFGDIYGNITIEDIDNSKELGIEVVLIGQANLGQSDFNLYGQVFVKNEPDWAETLTVAGLSWDKSFDNGLFLQTALGASFIIADYRGLGSDEWSNGYNGGYFYVAAAKPFEIANQQFSLSWNQEHFWGRDDVYLALTGDKEDFGFNGWLIADYFVTSNTAISISYRYSNNNMGIEGFSDGIFYSVKHIF